MAYDKCWEITGRYLHGCPKATDSISMPSFSNTGIPAYRESGYQEYVDIYNDMLHDTSSLYQIISMHNISYNKPQDRTILELINALINQCVQINKLCNTGNFTSAMFETAKQHLLRLRGMIQLIKNSVRNFVEKTIKKRHKNSLYRKGMALNKIPFSHARKFIDLIQQRAKLSQTPYDHLTFGFKHVCSTPNIGNAQLKKIILTRSQQRYYPSAGKNKVNTLVAMTDAQAKEELLHYVSKLDTKYVMAEGIKPGFQTCKLTSYDKTTNQQRNTGFAPNFRSKRKYKIAEVGIDNAKNDKNSMYLANKKGRYTNQISEIPKIYEGYIYFGCRIIDNELRISHLECTSID